MPSPSPSSSPVLTSDESRRRSVVMVVQSPSAAVAQLASRLTEHQVRVQQLAEAEDAVLTRAYMLEQLCAQWSPSPAGTRALPFAELREADSDADHLAAPTTVVQETGRRTLHTWLPLRHADDPLGVAPQRVRLDAGGLTAMNQALYRSLSVLVHPTLTSTTTEPALYAADQSRDPFLTPEGTECICDDVDGSVDDDDDGDSVVSVPTAELATGTSPTTTGPRQVLAECDALLLTVPMPRTTDEKKEADANEESDAPSEEHTQEPPNSFAKLAYAPPSAPLAPTSLSDDDDDDDDDDDAAVMTAELGDPSVTAVSHLAEDDNTAPVSNARLKKKTPTPVHTIPSAHSLQEVDGVDGDVLREDAEQNKGEDGEDDEDDCVVQSSPPPHRPARPVMREGRGVKGHRSSPPLRSTASHSTSLPPPDSPQVPRARPTPSPVQRELDAFFPSPAKATGDTAPVPRRHGRGEAVREDGALRDCHPPKSAVDLLARIPPIPDRHAALARTTATDDGSHVSGRAPNDGRRAAAGARPRRPLRAVPGLDKDGVGHVRTKRRRDEDYETEQRTAREDAMLLEEDGASRSTPPCTPSIYWDTTMPSPYRK